MTDLEQEPDSPEVKIEKASEHLETSKEHEERAKELAKEAKDEVADKINKALADYEKQVQVESKYGRTPPHILVTVLDRAVREAIEDSVSADAEIRSSYPQKFAIARDAADSGFNNKMDAVKNIISEMEPEYESGVPVEEVIIQGEMLGMKSAHVELEIDKLKNRGEVYESPADHLRTT